MFSIIFEKRGLAYICDEPLGLLQLVWQQRPTLTTYCLLMHNVAIEHIWYVVTSILRVGYASDVLALNHDFDENRFYKTCAHNGEGGAP